MMLMTVRAVINMSAVNPHVMVPTLCAWTMQVLVVVPLAVLCSTMPPTPGRVAQGETATSTLRSKCLGLLAANCTRHVHQVHSGLQSLTATAIP